MDNYSLLVVDDEQIAVWGLTRTIEWETIGINEVYEAYDVESALEILSKQHVDIVISDVEMPGLNGIDLLKWIKKNSPSTKTIFLSAHAEFAYAQEALALGSLKYILKPVAHDQLKEEIVVVLDTIKKEYEELESQKYYHERLKTWESNIDTMSENFWYNILNGHRNLTSKEIDNYIQVYEIPLLSDEMLTPIFVSVESFQKYSLEDREALAMTLKEYISTVMFSTYQGASVLYEGDILLLIYGSEDLSLYHSGILNTLSLECEENFQCSVSFYMGRTVGIRNLAKEYNRLSWVYRRNTSDEKKRVYSIDFKPGTGEMQTPPPNVSNWLTVLASGKKKGFVAKTNTMFDELEKTTPISRCTLEEIFVGLNYIFLVAARRNGLLGTFQDFNSTSWEVIKSVSNLREWADKITLEYFEAFEGSERNSSVIVQKVEKYVLEHISEEFNREDIACALYFNPSYLSRVFKMEKGITLNEYIVQLKLEQAKKLFDTTNMSVSTIAKETGYYNFSYFSKQFKDAYGMTPSEYKKSQVSY